MSPELAELLSFNLYSGIVELALLVVVRWSLLPGSTDIRAFTVLYIVLVSVVFVSLLVEHVLPFHDRSIPISVAFGLVALFSLPAFSGVFILLLAISYLRDKKTSSIVLVASMVGMFVAAEYLSAPCGSWGKPKCVIFRND